VKKKTIKELLETLPDGIREKALANMESDLAGRVVESLADAVDCAFFWETTPEGVDYWDKIFRRLCES